MGEDWQGPHAIVRTATFRHLPLDGSDPFIDVVWPVADDERRSFPLLVFGHGWSLLANASYGQLLAGVASWGYVVAAPRSCRFGCTQTCADPTELLQPGDPCRTFASWYVELLKTVEWSRHSDDAAQLPINVSAGVGVAGHSMGGAATMAIAAWPGAAEYGIRAAILIDPGGGAAPIYDVPFLVLTGSNDTMAGWHTGRNIFAAAPDAALPRGLAERRGANHMMPIDRGEHPEWDDRWMQLVLQRNPRLMLNPEGLLARRNGGGNRSVILGSGFEPRLAFFVAAWTKLYVDGIRAEAVAVDGAPPPSHGARLENATREVDYREALYGGGPGSLCGGGDGEMTLCTMHAGGALAGRHSAPWPPLASVFNMTPFAHGQPVEPAPAPHAPSASDALPAVIAIACTCAAAVALAALLARRWHRRERHDRRSKQEVAAALLFSDSAAQPSSAGGGIGEDALGDLDSPPRGLAAVPRATSESASAAAASVAIAQPAMATIELGRADE